MELARLTSADRVLRAAVLLSAQPRGSRPPRGGVGVGELPSETEALFFRQYEHQEEMWLPILFSPSEASLAAGRAYLARIMARPDRDAAVSMESVQAQAAAIAAYGAQNPVGRVIRFDPDGHNPKLIQGGLASPNGISFDAAYDALWVSEFTAGREDYLPLNADHSAVTGGHTAIYASEGTAQFDSNAVDAAGNIYQCIWGGGKVLVYRGDGSLIARIVVPQTGPTSELLTTNLAIRPGTTQGYLIVGGKRGGFIYSFRSLAPGGSQSNGGGR